MVFHRRKLLYRPPAFISVVGGGVLIDHGAAQFTSASSGASVTLNSTGANFLVAIIMFDGLATGVTFGDNKSNSFTTLTPQASGVGGTAELIFNQGGTVGASHTFTLSGTNAYGAIVVGAFSNAIASPLDQQNGNSATSGASAQPGSVTPTTNNQLVITGVGIGGLGGTTSITGINGGFNFVDNIGSNTFYGAALAYLKNGASAPPANPTFSLSGSQAWECPIATFKGT